MGTRRAGHRSLRWRERLAAASAVLLLSSCGRIGSRPEDPARAVVRQYAEDLRAAYEDAVAEIAALDEAVGRFVEAPDAAGLERCRAAWLSAHRWYGRGEVSRFYGGPMDRAQNGMNEWPIDENFIDYTIGNPGGGIINDPEAFPQITAPALASADEKGVETVSTGFHAIEFLLWGQRADQRQGPGTRPYTDYVEGGTAAHPDRRRAYLRVATSLLLDDMRGLAADWDPADPASYASRFLAGDPHEALTKMVRGFSQMAISELLYERLLDPLVSQDRKDEESCFSESTHADLVANAWSLEDFYLGQYRARSGVTRKGRSVSDLVRARDADLDRRLGGQLAAVRAAIEAIPPPFDHAVLAPPKSPENDAVQAAVAAFQPVQGMINEAARVLGVVNNL